MRGIVAFLIPVAFGALSYLLATLAARLISRVPRHIYIGRIVFMAVFVVLFWFGYMPSTAEKYSDPRPPLSRTSGFSGPAELPGAKSIGILYGAPTVWIWCVLAVLHKPKDEDDSE